MFLFIKKKKNYLDFLLEFTEFYWNSLKYIDISESNVET